MCPEAVWGQPPTTSQGTSGGFTNQLLGVAYSRPHRFFVVEPGDGIQAKATVENPANEIDGTMETTRTILSEKVYHGGFDFKADPENLYYPLLGIFGKDAGGTTQASNSTQVGMYTHTLVPNSTAGSFAIEEIFGDATYGRLTGGYIIESVEITVGKIVTAKMLGYGKKQAPNTYPDQNNANQDYVFNSTYSLIPGNTVWPLMGGNTDAGSNPKAWKCTPTPVYCDVAQSGSATAPSGPGGNGPLSFAGMAYGSQAGFASAFIKIDGVAQPNIEILPGFTIGFYRALDVSMIAGSQFDIGACTSKAWTCKGKMLFNFKDQSVQQAYLRHSTFALNFKLLGPKNGTSGTNWAAEFYIPNMHFLTSGPNIPEGAIQAGGEWVARQDPSVTPAPYTAQVILTNSVVSGSIAGGGSGGLGGASIS